MIKNDEEKQTMEYHAAQFTEAIREMEGDLANPGEVSVRLRQASIDGMKSLREDILEELAEYDALKRGEIHLQHVQNLQDLPEALIKARIARGWSQKDLAKRLRIREQQVQRYENDEYERVPFWRMVEIASVLGVQISAYKFDLAA